MGYYTFFELNTNSNVISKLHKLYPETIEMVDENGLFEQEYKWYDHEEQLKHLSTYFPNEVIELCCDGEDSIQWREYYKNGKQQIVEGKIVFEPYDEKLLK